MDTMWHFFPSLCKPFFVKSKFPNFSASEIIAHMRVLGKLCLDHQESRGKALEQRFEGVWTVSSSTSSPQQREIGDLRGERCCLCVGGSRNCVWNGWVRKMGFVLGCYRRPKRPGNKQMLTSNKRSESDQIINRLTAEILHTFCMQHFFVGLYSTFCILHKGQEKKTFCIFGLFFRS